MPYYSGITLNSFENRLFPKLFWLYRRMTKYVLILIRLVQVVIMEKSAYMHLNRVGWSSSSVVGHSRTLKLSAIWSIARYALACLTLGSLGHAPQENFEK